MLQVYVYIPYRNPSKGKRLPGTKGSNGKSNKLRRGKKAQGGV
jgi:hypothetical protein